MLFVSRLEVPADLLITSCTTHWQWKIEISHISFCWISQLYISISVRSGISEFSDVIWEESMRLSFPGQIFSQTSLVRMPYQGCGTKASRRSNDLRSCHRSCLTCSWYEANKFLFQENWESEEDRRLQKSVGISISPSLSVSEFNKMQFVRFKADLISLMKLQSTRYINCTEREKHKLNFSLGIGPVYQWDQNLVIFII